MSEILQRNLAVIDQRWPDVAQRLVAENADAVPAQLIEGQGSTLSVAGIQLTSRHDRLAEAQLQADSLPAASPRLHVYGTGLGDLQRVLLAADTLQVLHVHILNGALFALVLQLLEQRDWLSDPRVVLAYADAASEIRLPFFALPAELVLTADSSARIRDRLVSEVHVGFNNQEFSADNPDNVRMLEQGKALLRCDTDVADLFGSQPGREVWVIATGPSLQQHLPRLAAMSGYPMGPLLICVDTAYVPLRRQGIRPDVVVSIDHRISTRHLPSDDTADIALVYLPRQDAQMLEAWQGPRYAAYSSSPVYSLIRQQMPKADLHVGGSVIHPAVDLAVKMGAARITLFGADFAFPGGKTHTGWQDGDLGPQLHVARHWVHDGRGEKVTTQLNLRSYLIELERYIARHPEVQFFNTSRDGAMIAGTQFDPDWTAP
ncbi:MULTISPECIES: motility associated factor glycosyltransferase family protein [unclassified Pseudomonas]|uniref:motility associated factor glycosyltransferase family protein n=1 Tax=unclassified Pseudomonas TaxID=196821 RepID=UPI0025F053F1|nr:MULTISPECIES: 6-hydroxymethylpterin diphosphokinase MptE-like protein [unclassified Pseudomonas]